MSIFCIVKDNDEHFDTNIDMDFSYAAIEEWKHKWTPKSAVGRKGSKRDYGYVTYKVTNEAKHFPDSKFEDSALAIALRQWGLRTNDI